MGDSGDSSDNLSFKVDLRVVKDTPSRRKKEADKANCGISRIDPGLVKITNDRTKLLLESKAVLDRIFEEDPGRAKEISVPALQLVGNILFRKEWRILFFNSWYIFLGNHAIL